MILAILWAIIATITAIYYYKKSKENYHLFELSKSYGPTKEDAKKLDGAIASLNFSPKLNKDGSIAKKRGRKPRA